MKLVLINDRNRIEEDYGEFSAEQAENILVSNEVQLRLVTDTLGKMGLVHGDPSAIEDWMRPYITNEIQRQAKRENAFERANNKLSAYREQAWDWVKAALFGGMSRLFSRIINHFTRKK